MKNTKLKDVYPCQRLYHYLLFSVHIYQQQRCDSLLDGYFGNNNTLQMVRDRGLHLISKLRRDAALYLPPTTPYQGRGRPALYGEKFNPREIDPKYQVSTQTQGNITTEVYQIESRHKRNSRRRQTL